MARSPIKSEDPVWHPDGMGERFQAMGFARDVEFGHAYLIGDLTYRL